MELALAALIFATIAVLVVLFVVFRELRALQRVQRQSHAWQGRSQSLEKLLAILPYPVLVVDRDGNCLEEFAPSDLPGREILERLPEDQRRTFVQRLRSAIDERRVGQMRLLVESRWLEADLLPLPPAENEAGKATVVLRDATAEMDSASRAEQLAARNEAILRSAMDGFFVVGENYRFLEVNDAFCRMTGYEASELLRKRISELEVNERPLGLGASTHNRTGLHHFTTTHKHRDGHLIQLEISVIVLRDGGHKILVGFARDVTERSRAEEALRESEDRFRRLSDLTFEGIAVHEDGAITDANQSFARMFGYALGEIVGTDGLDYIAPSSRDHISRSALVGSHRPIKATGLRKDGSTFPIEICSRPIPHLGRRAVVSAIRDITLRKRAEDALRESEKKYRDLVETSHDLIWSLDAEGRWTFVNQAARRIYGCEPEEMLGRRVTEFAAAGRAEQDLEVFERVRAGTPHFHYETEHRRRDGTPVVLSFNAMTLRDEQGQIIGATGTATDITERKQAERDRRRLEKRMQEAQKLESLGVLAGGVAHDFNNYLVGVLCNTSQAMESLPEYSEARRHLQKVIKASRRASELTRQMLAYSGRATYDVHPLDLSALVTELAEFHRATLPKNVELRIEPGADLPQIEADSGQIHQIITNMLINGAEAIGDRPGTLTVATSLRTLDKRDITLNFAEQDVTPGRFVCLEVRDTGCGMAADTMSRIFDPFFTTKFTGRGLGLAAILGIVRAHRGALKVESELDQGTVFTALFPASATRRRAAAVQTPRRDLPRSTTVLVIDDEEDIREAVESVLAGRGARVLTADGGPRGIELFRQHADEIDVVLLDVTMPGMNGDEVLREIRRIRENARVILSSGYSEQEAVGGLGDLRITGFVHKPYTADVLVERVGFALDGRLSDGHVAGPDARL